MESNKNINQEIIDAQSLEFLKPVKVKMVRAPELELNPKFRVERLPMISTNFYFTHDFWLTPATLIIQTPLTINDSEFARFSDSSILFTAQFEKDSSECIINRILPTDLKCKGAVLSNNKEFLCIAYDNEVVLLRTKDWSVFKSLPMNIPKFYQFGQLSLTSDDRFLMHEVNLDWNDPLAYKRVRNNDGAVKDKLNYSSWINLMELDSGKVISYAHKPYPFMWNHILSNPKDPKQITSALIRYLEPFPKTTECDQRLWFTDISSLYRSSELSDHLNTLNLTPIPLYNQRKKSLFKPAERVTHECWCENGKYLTFIVRRKKLKRVYVEKENFNKSEVIMNDGPNPWHCDGSIEGWFVFDTQNKDTGIWMGKTDRSELTNLCKEHTQAHGQIHHPHPFFSKDMRYVYFNADAGKDCYVHRVRTTLY